MEQLQSHIEITASSYTVNYLCISSYIRQTFLIYNFATAPFWISLYMRKIWFFLSVYIPQVKELTGRDVWRVSPSWGRFPAGWEIWERWEGAQLHRGTGLKKHDIFVWIRIRIHGSMHLTNGSRSGFGSWSCYFLIIDLQDANKKLI